MVGILGSSKQARAQLQAIHSSVPTVERARVYSPTPEHREAFAAEMGEWLDLPIEAVASAEAATRDADIVGLANSSRQPVLDPAWVKPGALVISISGGQLPDGVIGRWQVASTTWDSLAAREPYASRVRAGTFSKGDVGAELGSVVALAESFAKGVRQRQLDLGESGDGCLVAAPDVVVQRNRIVQLGLHYGF